VSKLSTLPSWIFRAFVLMAIAMVTSLAGVTSCDGVVAAVLDAAEAPAAATPAETAPAPNPFAGLKPAFT
jgi:hypothetical protein